MKTLLAVLLPVALAGAGFAAGALILPDMMGEKEPLKNEESWQVRVMDDEVEVFFDGAWQEMGSAEDLMGEDPFLYFEPQYKEASLNEASEDVKAGEVPEIRETKPLPAPSIKEETAVIPEAKPQIKEEVKQENSDDDDSSGNSSDNTPDERPEPDPEPEPSEPDPEPEPEPEPEEPEELPDWSEDIL